MPNWCFTSYVAEGPKEQLQKLSDIMICTSVVPSPGYIPNDFGSSWLGNLVCILGVDPREQRDFRCRGEYYDVDLNESGYLTFNTTTAWCEADDTRHLIEKKFPGVHLYFISEEFGCQYWETNDIEGKYFSERYYFQAGDYNNTEGKYCSTLPELINAITEATGLTGMLTFEDCDQVLQDYMDGDYDYSLYQIEFEQ